MSEELQNFFYFMYEVFGQGAVMDFVANRQANGQLTDVAWRDCLGCEETTPNLENTCLVCGGY